MASTSTTNNTRPTVAIMRPARYEQESLEICRRAGFDVISAPMIEILDKRDEQFDGFVSRVLGRQSDIVIFTSANGIDYALDKVPNRDSFIKALNLTTTIAIGPRTRAAAAEQGIDISFMPESYSSEGLVEALKDRVKGKVVDIARSSHGAHVLVEGLEEAGAEVFETQVYRISIPELGSKQRELIKAVINGKVDAVMFTSSMMVRNLLDMAAKLGVGNELTTSLNRPGTIVAAIGQPTANTLNIYKIQVNNISREYTFDALIDEVRKEYDIN